MTVMPALKDPRLFARYFGISVLGTIVDYTFALLLAGLFAVPLVGASTCGFILGSVVNYFGHTLFSYAHTDKRNLSILGYGRYFFAVLFSLFVRLAVVGILEYLSALPFWLVLLVSIGASFVVTYVISTLWVFRRPG